MQSIERLTLNHREETSRLYIPRLCVASNFPPQFPWKRKISVDDSLRTFNVSLEKLAVTIFYI